MIIPEPHIIPGDEKQSEFWYTDYLTTLFRASQNLQLTSRDGAIQNGDKAGNLSAQFVVYTSNGTANTEDTVSHTLGRVPVGYITVLQDKAAVVYDSGTDWTETAMYLKTSVATVTQTLLVF